MELPRPKQALYGRSCLVLGQKLAKRLAPLSKFRIAGYNLDAAIAAARQGEYREALWLFGKLQRTLEEGGLLESQWAEIYVAQAICHARLGDMGATRQVWQKANAREPDNEALKRIAVRLGLVKT